MFFLKKKKNINVIKLKGVLLAQGRNSLSLDGSKGLIDKAFDDKKAKAVVLIVNSPGGSPVQSEMIANYIQNKAKKNKVDVVTLVEDMAASGGYWISIASKEVYALSKSSIIGSIGVISAGFGFSELIKKYGIERRVYTAGKNKSILDSFSSEKPEDIEFLRGMLSQLHEHFKNWVKDNRGSRLKIEEDELFSGRFWLASKAKEYGLIDGVIDDYKGFLESRYGKNIKINEIKEKKGLLKGLFGLKLKVELDEQTVSNIITNVKSELTYDKYSL